MSISKNIRFFTFLNFLAGVILLTIVTPGYSQIWTDYNDHDPGIVSVEAMIPSLENFTTIDAPSASYLIYSRFSVGNNIWLTASLPVSHFKNKSADISETSIGNAYIGGRFGSSHSNGINFETGVYLPLAKNDAEGLATGIISDINNLSRYLPETTTLTGRLRYYRDSDSGFIIRAGAGPDILIPKSGESELFVAYYGQFLYRVNTLTLGAGLTATSIVTEKNLSFGDRTNSNIGIMSSLDFGGIRAGAYLRLPLDDEVNDFLNYVLGLHFGIIL